MSEADVINRRAGSLQLSERRPESSDSNEIENDEESAIM
jgi:hypothetical protein